MNESLDRLGIRQLDLSRIPPNTRDQTTGCKIAIIGKPGTGKSNLILALLYAKSTYIPAAVVMNGNEEINRTYSNVIPRNTVHTSYDESVLERVILRQTRMSDLPRDKYNPYLALVIDDCTDDPKVFKSKVQGALFRRGRWFHMLYILAMHSATDLPSFVRSCTDGVFLLRNPSKRERRILYENYASVIPSMRLFEELMDAVAQDFTALYIDNRATTNNWRDCVFWYKAPFPPCPQGWKFGSAYTRAHAISRMR